MPCAHTSQFRNEEKSYLVSLDRLSELKRVFGLQVQADGSQRGQSDGEWTVLASFPGRDLAGLAFAHPTHPRLSPILCGAHVTNDSGTGYSLAMCCSCVCVFA